jgi:hypothetical protein
MKVVGFSIIRNAIIYDYPIVEAILSIEPLCDEIIIAVGKSEDNTLALVSQIHPKVRIIETIWNDNLRKSGLVLAVETNKAFDAIPEDTDWCFYIQADEVLHEKYYNAVQKSMQIHLNDVKVEGLLFDYQHFYGSYDFIGDSRNWYRKEIRIIRKNNAIRSYLDAQGFRKAEKKLQVMPANASIYHYGWVKHPKYQQMKQKNFNRYWHDDDWVNENISDVNEFDYTQIGSLKKFEGTHPAVMQQRIKQMNWQFSFDPTQKKLSPKESLSRWIEQATGIRIGEYKNYKLLK